MAKSMELVGDVSAFIHPFDETWKMDQVKQFYNIHAEEFAEDLKLYAGATTLIKTFLEVAGKDVSSNMRVLDVGCGTGLLGRQLKKHGVTNIDGLDISENMLEIAKKDDVYKNYIVADITQAVQAVAIGTYDAIISSGAISLGLIKACALEEFGRLVRPGGFVCFTLRRDCYDKHKYGYHEKLNELNKNGKWEELKNFLTQYYDYSHNDIQKKCYILCYKVLKN